ncbi:unnamed protein product [Pleuronectes platessa]|uniref:Uncharacterized protein n=1 Tax=Pleuronectes platessa TaxID=8262 RepID=A0A9N7Y6X0_PLEPL|nr:unnamed protein product [Pleuronectes platessa]
MSSSLKKTFICTWTNTVGEEPRNYITNQNFILMSSPGPDNHGDFVHGARGSFSVGLTLIAVWEGVRLDEVADGNDPLIPVKKL